MSANSSSFSYLDAWKEQECVLIFISLFIFYILLIPLFIFILYLGCQRWRKRRSGSTSETSSHSDIITYNMVTMEMISILGSCLFLYGLFGDQIIMVFVGMYLWDMILIGENLFHILTCIERYLAVVHPVTYLRLRQSGGVRIRNISIGCVWLICFGSIGLASYPVSHALKISLSVLSLIVVCFCSLSVLRVLIHPGPGDVGGNRGRVDQSKKRAFQTIMVIMAALIVRLVSSVVTKILPGFTVSLGFSCKILWSLGWLYSPSSLVLPLLFLHRAGKLPRCKTNTEHSS